MMVWLESLWRGLRNLLHGNSMWGSTEGEPMSPSGKGVVADVIRLLDANKAYAAFLAPVIVAFGTAAASWAVTGEFGTNELRIAVGGAIAAVTASVATYFTPAAKAEVREP